jgi:hypothetical protein
MASNAQCAYQANVVLAEQLRSDSAPKLLRVARLWAIMLNYCGRDFLEYNCSPNLNFLKNVESVIMSGHAGPGVAERFLRVLASAVCDFSGGDPRHSYTILWLKVKPPGQPEQVLPPPSSPCAPTYASSTVGVPS